MLQVSIATAAGIPAVIESHSILLHGLQEGSGLVHLWSSTDYLTSTRSAKKIHFLFSSPP